MVGDVKDNRFSEPRPIRESATVYSRWHQIEAKAISVAPVTLQLQCNKAWWVD